MVAKWTGSKLILFVRPAEKKEWEKFVEWKIRIYTTDDQVKKKEYERCLPGVIITKTLFHNGGPCLLATILTILDGWMRRTTAVESLHSRVHRILYIYYLQVHCCLHYIITIMFAVFFYTMTFSFVLTWTLFVLYKKKCPRRSSVIPTNLSVPDILSARYARDWWRLIPK